MPIFFWSLSSMLMQSSKTKGPYILTSSVFPILKRSLWSFWVIRRLAGCGLEHGSIEKKSVKLQLLKQSFWTLVSKLVPMKTAWNPKQSANGSTVNVKIVYSTWVRTLSSLHWRSVVFSNEHEDFGRKSHRCEAANFFEPKVKSVILFVDGFRKIKNCERLGL